MARRDQLRDKLQRFVLQQINAQYQTATIGQFVGGGQWQSKDAPPGYVAITLQDGLEAEAFNDGQVVPMPGQTVTVLRVQGRYRVVGTEQKPPQQGDNAAAPRGFSIGLHNDNIGKIHFVPFDEASMIDGGAEVEVGTTNIKFKRKMYIDDAGRAKVYAGGDTTDVQGTYGNSLAGGEQAWVLVYIAPSTGTLSFYEASGATAPINATTDLENALDDFYDNVSAGVPYLAIRVGRGAVNYKRYKPADRYDFDNKDIIRFHAEGFTTLASLADVDLTSVVDGAILKYNASAQEWVDGNLQIDELGDVNTSSPFNSAHYLGYDAGVWVNRLIQLDELGNVRTDDVTTGNILIASGGAFESHPLSVDDVQEGTLAHEHGGLEADVSNYAGIPLIDGGSTSEIKYNLTATTDPDNTDDSYDVGSLWVNTDKDRVWQCVDNTASNAVWNLVSGRVACIATRTSNVSVSNNTVTAIPFDSESVDTDAMHDNTTNNTRITVPFDGLYQVNGALRYTPDSSNLRDIRFEVNGGGTYEAWSRQNASSVSDSALTTSALLDLSASDYVELIAFQNSGSALDVRLDVELQVIMIAGEGS